MWPHRVIVPSNAFTWNLNAPCTGNLECCLYWIFWITWDRNEIEEIWIYFSTGNFLCCIQKNQLYKSKFKSCVTIADMWLHSSHFCAENPPKILKQVQGERWGLKFSHTQAQCSGGSCRKIVGQKGLPCWARMFHACCGAFSPICAKTHKCRNTFFWFGHWRWRQPAA